jgi:hypothetical protein
VRRLFLAALFVCLALPVCAQQADFAFGVGTVSSTSGASASGNYFPQDVGGGAFPGFSGDYLFRHGLGVEGEIFWRAGQNTYAGSQPFRPLFWAFNGIWAPAVGSHFTPELLAGIGAESIRFYQPFFNVFTGTNYVSQNQFMGDFGGGLRFYVTHAIFVRPEARVYLIHNNFLFSSGHAQRYGVSIGYSFGKQ